MNEKEAERNRKKNVIIEINAEENWENVSRKDNSREEKYWKGKEKIKVSYGSQKVIVNVNWSDVERKVELLKGNS